MGFMGLVFDRIAMMIINILFPPLTVMILSGFGWDLILNCLFFLAAVIPAHIHGFYISMTYFHRKSKVRNFQEALPSRFGFETNAIVL